MELALTSVFLLILCFFAGCFATFLHYCIGEPRHGHDGSDFKAGRIFSFYGRFVAIRYQRAYIKENERINGIFQSEGAKSNGNISDEKEFEILSSFRPIIWQALGACPICFATWINLIVFAILLPVFGMSLFWGLLLVPTATIISGRIRLS